MRAIKLFIDGAMGSRGGLLFEPYGDDPGNTGLLLIEPEVLEADHRRRPCGTAGRSAPTPSATGATPWSSTPTPPPARPCPRRSDPRLRIEHAQVVRKADVARFAALGVIASMQPSHASDDMRWADARLGPGRVDGAYAWRWFLDAGVALAFGSDFPVEVVNPFWGIYAAVTRQDEKGKPPGGWHPDQRMTPGGDAPRLHRRLGLRRLRRGPARRPQGRACGPT